MSPARTLKAKLWRLLLRARFELTQRHRHQRLVLEQELGFPLVILPEVFNPTLFSSTAFVLDCLTEGMVPDGARVLDLGTGSGVLAVAAAARASSVVAVDINAEAVRCARINALLNRVENKVEVRNGDLFAPVQDQSFDLILCNPPYFSGRPTTPMEGAFFAGDWPQRLAEGLPAHLADGGSALVVLSSDGEERSFLRRFTGAGLEIEIVAERNLVSERVTLYRLRTAR